MNVRALGLGSLCVAALAVAAILVFDGSDDGYIVKAEFKDAGGIRKNSDVKIGEVPAGTVTNVDLSNRDTAVVTMRLDSGVGPVGVGASARSRPVNLLGEKYVDLDQGDVLRPLGSGTEIPEARTRTSVELDDILNTLSPGVRARLRILINEAGIAMSGRGADFSRMLAEMPSGLHEATAFLDALSSDTDKLASLVDRGDRVLASVAGRRKELGRLVDVAASVLKTTASRRAALARTVATAPAGLAALRTTLDALRATADDLGPAAANLRRTSQPLAGTLRQIPGFADDGRQTLAAATHVAPALDRLATVGTPTVRRLRPTLENLARFTGDIGPLTRELGERSVKQLLRFMNNWSTLTNGNDGLSHIFRVRILLSPEALTSKGAPSSDARRRPARRPAPKPLAGPVKGPSVPQPDREPKVPAPLSDLPQVLTDATRKILGDAPPAVKDILKGALGPAASARPRDDAADGARYLLDYLLGN